MPTPNDTLKSILALARAGADTDLKDFMREHLLAIAELARKALQENKSPASGQGSD